MGCSEAEAAFLQDLPGDGWSFSQKTEFHCWVCERGNGAQELGKDFVFYGPGETDLGILQPIQVSVFNRGWWRALKRAAEMMEGLEKQLWMGRTYRAPSVCVIKTRG